MRNAFTLIELLVSIALLGLMVPALFESIDVLRQSNEKVASHLRKNEIKTRSVEALYLDIASSDGNLTIRRADDYVRLCIEHTKHSLYGLCDPKVCWGVTRESKTMVRTEGVSYRFPPTDRDEYATESVFESVEAFDVEYNRKEVFVYLKLHKEEPLMFVVYGISPPEKIKKTSSKRKKSSVKKGTSSKTTSSQNQVK